MSETTIYKEGFNAGFMQLRQIDVEAATKELCRRWGLTTATLSRLTSSDVSNPMQAKPSPSNWYLGSTALLQTFGENRNESRSRTNAARNPNSRIVGLGSRKKGSGRQAFYFAPNG